MKNGASFVVWQPVLTDHQAFTLEALARASGVPVIVYVMRMEDEVRRAQGWTDTRVKTVERRALPTTGTLSYCYQRLREHKDDVHIFGSPFENFRMMLALLMAAYGRIEFYLISEPYSPRSDGYFDDTGRVMTRAKALLRPMIYRCYGLIIGRRTRGVFSISRLAAKQYARAGVPANRLFGFGYFVPALLRSDTLATRLQAADKGLRLVFVGSLIRRKGLDLLVEAVNQLADAGQPVTLDIYGPRGAPFHTFDGGRARYRGPIPFGEVQAVVAEYDALVLPSRFDGWGVVVNEALCAYVPVLCSDRVGARVLVERFGAGAVFALGDTRSIYELLDALLKDPARLTAMREAARITAPLIKPEIAAGYMLSVIKADETLKASIVAPWYASPENSHA